MNPALSTRSPNTLHASVVSSRSFADFLLRPTAADWTKSHLRTALHSRSPTQRFPRTREEFEALDRQILVVSADVPPQDGETDEQRQERENANVARAVRRQQELAIAAPSVGHQPANTGQVNANVGQQAPAAPAAPQQRHQDDPPRANRLRARDLLRDFEHDGLEVYNSPQTNLGAALNHLEVPQWSDAVDG
jgi:hypothetical protein